MVQSKDQITAGNAVRKDQMEGKAAIANKTTSCVFKLLQDAGEISFLLIYISFIFCQAGSFICTKNIHSKLW